MKLYSIRRWNELFENNRSRELKELKWTVVPNRHDGETYTQLITHKNGALMFAAWVLILQVASKCSPRGTLVRGNGTPLDAVALSVKTRAPLEWFEMTLEWLEKNSDWLESSMISAIPHMGAGIPQETDVHPAPRDEEGKGIEGNRREGNNGHASPSLMSEILDEWNQTAGLKKCLLLSDKRRRSLESRLRNSFFISNWKNAISRTSTSLFCRGENDRGWAASFDWFIQPDTVIKIMEGKYDNSTNGKDPTKPYQAGGNF